MIRASQLRALLNLDPLTGCLIWRKRGSAAFDDKYAGKPAMAYRGRHNFRGSILGQQYPTHRVVWAIHTGEWPVAKLAHLDGDGFNNAVDNLEEISNTESAKHGKIRRDNTSGVTGVVFNNRLKSWGVVISIDGRPRRCGHFASFDEAVIVRREAERQHGYHLIRSKAS